MIPEVVSGPATERWLCCVLVSMDTVIAVLSVELLSLCCAVLLFLPFAFLIYLIFFATVQ